MSQTDVALRAQDEASLARKSLVPLLIVFILGILSLQAFNLIFLQIGSSLNAINQAPLITSIPTIVLGIVCFMYGSLGDMVSLRKMMMWGLGALVAGSLLGFLVHVNIWWVILARGLQTAGAQVAGSIYMLVTVRYIEPSKKVLYFGIFTAAYQFSTALAAIASGIIMAMDWAYLFLLPLIALVFAPVFMKTLPDQKAAGSKIDVAGFVIFGVAIACLTLYFSYGVTFLVGAAVMLAIFVIYIHKVKEPFITPAFFKNKRWLMAMSLIVLFYFPNYCISVLFKSMATGVFGASDTQIAIYLIWTGITGALVGTSSGTIVRNLGHARSVVLAGSLGLIGCALMAFAATGVTFALVAGAICYFAGMGLMFAPMTDTVLGTVDPSEVGRGIGMNDLVMNVTASVGISVFGTQLAGGVFSSGGLMGTVGIAATTQVLLLAAGIIFALGLVVFMLVKSRIVSEQE